jgi:hypothetical protein
MLIAQGAIEALHGQTVYSPYLRSSFSLGHYLVAALKSVTDTKDLTRTIDAAELWHIKRSYSQYKTALLAELGILNSYFVTQKGGFDTISLLTWGENLYPPDLAQKVPEAIFDAKESGKCLAYEVPTACGFHVFRALEGVLRRYHAHVTGGASAPRVRSIGAYVRSLEIAGKGDPKILAVLERFHDLRQ